MNGGSILFKNIGFIDHVARYVPSLTYVYEQNTAPIHIN